MCIRDRASTQRELARWCVCEVLETEDSFTGDPRPGLLDKMVDDESERDGRIGLLLLSRRNKHSTKYPKKPVSSGPSEIRWAGELVGLRTISSGYPA